MMRLLIDNKPAEIDSNQSVSVSLSIASITNIEQGRTGYSKAFRVPDTLVNRAIFGDASQVNSIEMFNQQSHMARLEVAGCTVMEGRAMLARYERDAGCGWYVMNIIGSGREWVQIAAQQMFNELPIEYEKIIVPSIVASGWEDSSAVKFFPVLRDSLAVTSDQVEGCVRMLTFSDYHPFISVRAIIDAIVGQAGYKIRSQFMDGEMFRSLYMSGNYPEIGVGDAVEMMGFKAGITTSKSALADSFGRVYANPWSSTSSIGNVVESAEAFDFAQNRDGIYNTNNVFAKSGAAVNFTPTESVVVGFEYHLKYRTDYVIKNREELRCFNSVYLNDMLERSYKVVNKNVDRRDDFRDQWQYKIFVFDHVAGSAYTLTCDTNDEQGCVLGSFIARVSTVEVRLGKPVRNPQLWVQSGSSKVLYMGDWALYNGYVGETGEIDVELTVRSTPGKIVPSEPQYFDLIHFGGASVGMKFTINPGTTIKPIYSAMPTEGSKVKFEDLAAHRVRQIAVVDALKHMFNLYFYTDSLSKTIYVEPREQFYQSNVVDWSRKIDINRPITSEFLGADLNRELIFRYQGGDGSVARWDQAQKQVMGLWAAQVKNLFAKQGSKEYYNPLFTATINREGVYPDAAEASLALVGDRAKGGVNRDSENLNFPAKIVRFQGVKPLGGGSRWGWPSYGMAYPKIAFHNTIDTPFTLCFEDRDGAQGLHKYYDKNIELYNQSRRITAYVDLGAEDVEPFIYPNDLKRDFRALFKLEIDGETVMCRLEEIVDYNPAKKKSTKCVFIKNV